MPVTNIKTNKLVDLVVIGARFFALYIVLMIMNQDLAATAFVKAGFLTAFLLYAITKTSTAKVKQLLTSDKAVSAYWSMVTLALAWQTFGHFQTATQMGYLDIPDWRRTIALYSIAAATSAGVAATALLKKGRWVGALLVTASFALSLVPILIIFITVLCHGCDPGIWEGVIFFFSTSGVFLNCIAGIRQWRS